MSLTHKKRTLKTLDYRHKKPNRLALCGRIGASVFLIGLFSFAYIQKLPNGTQHLSKFLF